MTSAYSPPVQALIDELGRLPGIGPKSAQRIAFHLLKIPADDVARLASAISDAKAKVRFCQRCFNVTDEELCSFCRDDRRDSRVVCVVEESRDIVAVERTGEFNGRYHVLLGAMSPLEGIGPEQLKIRELLARIEPEGIEEVILCTNPNTEGEVTAMYLARQLRPLGLRVTRPASGLPVGGDLEYADELTLGRALEGRREVSRPTREPAAMLATARKMPGAPPPEPVAGGRAGSIDDAPERRNRLREGVRLPIPLCVNHVTATSCGCQATDVLMFYPRRPASQTSKCVTCFTICSRGPRGRPPGRPRRTTPPPRARRPGGAARGAGSGRAGCRSCRSDDRVRSRRR